MHNLVGPGVGISVSTAVGTSTVAGGGGRLVRTQFISSKRKDEEDHKCYTREELRQRIADGKCTGDECTEEISDFSDMLGLADAAIKSTFNVEIKWDTSKAVTMHSMFKGATVFNNNDEILVLNTDKVVDMTSMFYNNKGLTVELNLSSFDEVENMSTMFYGCTAYTNDISDWTVSDTCKANTRNSMSKVDAEAWPPELRPWRVDTLVEDSLLYHDLVLI